jgi:hypothetical protein
LLEIYFNFNFQIKSFYLISISLNVVNIAHVFCASLRRSAIFKRIRDILTLVSDRVPLILLGSIPLVVGACCCCCCLAGVTEICDVGVSRCGPCGVAGTEGVLLGAGPLVSADFLDASSSLVFPASTFSVVLRFSSSIKK